MDTNIKAEINRIGVSLKNRLQQVEEELVRYPDGRLSEYTRSGHTYLVLDSGGRNHRSRKNIPMDSALAADFVKRELLLKERNTLKMNMTSLRQCLAEINDYSSTQEIHALADRFLCLDETKINGMLRTRYEDPWEDKPYEQYDKYPEGKKHFTSRGLAVRSKSEVLIAERLYYYNIQFNYEEVLHIGKESIAPDFTITRPNGEIAYWEHMGMVHKEDYVHNQIRKLKMYALIDIVPWQNLIITYDTTDGNIDMRKVESEIVCKLL